MYSISSTPLTDMTSSEVCNYMIAHEICNHISERYNANVCGCNLLIQNITVWAFRFQVDIQKGSFSST